MILLPSRLREGSGEGLRAKELPSPNPSRKREGNKSLPHHNATFHHQPHRLHRRDIPGRVPLDRDDISQQPDPAMIEALGLKMPG